MLQLYGGEGMKIYYGDDSCDNECKMCQEAEAQIHGMCLSCNDEFDEMMAEEYARRRDD